MKRENISRLDSVSQILITFTGYFSNKLLQVLNDYRHNKENKRQLSQIPEILRAPNNLEHLLGSTLRVSESQSTLQPHIRTKVTVIMITIKGCNFHGKG